MWLGLRLTRFGRAAGVHQRIGGALIDLLWAWARRCGTHPSALVRMPASGSGEGPHSGHDWKERGFGSGGRAFPRAIGDGPCHMPVRQLLPPCTSPRGPRQPPPGRSRGTVRPKKYLCLRDLSGVFGPALGDPHLDSPLDDHPQRSPRLSVPPRGKDSEGR